MAEKIIDNTCIRKGLKKRLNVTQAQKLVSKCAKKKKKLSKREKLRSLRGVLGYFKKEKATYGTRVHFVNRKGKIVFKDLRKWEVKAAKPYKEKK